MDLLALSGGLVLVAAKRKAVRKWAGRRQFWACIDNDFVALVVWTQIKERESRERQPEN